MGEPVIPDEAVRLAAETIEDEAVRRIGRDLGTVHRDDIVRAGLAAAYPILAEQWRRDRDAQIDRLLDLDDPEALMREAAAYRSFNDAHRPIGESE